MSEPSSQQLQRHKDTVKDTLQGLLDTVAQVPGLIHESTSKEVSHSSSTWSSYGAAGGLTVKTCWLISWLYMLFCSSEP